MKQLTQLRSLALLVPALLGAACAQQPQQRVATQVPTEAPIVEVESVIEIPAPVVLTAKVDATDEDAEALLIASAMSYLGKTTAEFDGETMIEVEHDPDELLEEAFANPGFCALVLEADADPNDGRLSPPEAERLENAVLASLDG